jgi:UDP-N-acetylmuramate dehydrogenase
LNTLQKTHTVNLSSLNSLGLRASAYSVLSLTELSQLPQLAAALSGAPWFVLGGGSNVVLPEYYAGTVVQIHLKGVEQLPCDDGLRIKAFAGESWHGFVSHCMTQGWWGLENLALIPGTVGAAPIQNIGAYGLEVAQRIDSVTVWDCALHGLREIAAADCAFAYRDSVFKRNALGSMIVVAVTFKLPKPQDWQAIANYADVAKALQGQAKVNATMVFDAVVAIRQSKLPDPAVIGNVGSFFKNPLVCAEKASALLAVYPRLPHYPQPYGECKLAAAWLIDQCGFKGKAYGEDQAVGVHHNQALVIVNLAGQGHASATQIRALANSIEAAVFAKFGVQLEAEPLFV